VFDPEALAMAVMPIIQGIAAGDAIRFITHIRLELERTGSYRQGVLNSLRKIGKPLGATTVILCAMFTVYPLSPVAMLFYVGTPAIIGTGAALPAGYTLIPLLIYSLKPLGAAADSKEQKGGNP
jgi:predicted RND superfamily exporter protein